MSSVRLIFHGLSAAFVAGLTGAVVSVATFTSDPGDLGALMIAVSLSGMTVLAGIWSATIAILEPPTLTALERRLGAGILVLLTVSGPVLFFALGTAGG